MGYTVFCQYDPSQQHPHQLGQSAAKPAFQRTPHDLYAPRFHRAPPHP